MGMLGRSRAKQLCWLLMVFLLQASILSANSTHLILYYPPYVDQAKVLQQICHDGGVPTVILNVEAVPELVKGEVPEGLIGGFYHQVDEFPGADPDWTAYWDTVNPLIRPRSLIYGLNNPSPLASQAIKYITLLGNRFEIPPSFASGKPEVDGKWSSGSYKTDGDGGLTGPGTDLYYGMSFNGKALESYVPAAAVSRIPVTANSSTQYLLMTVDRTYRSTATVRSALFSSVDYAANQWIGDSLYTELDYIEGGNEQLYPYYRPITAHTGKLPDGNYKIFTTKIVADGYSSPDLDLYPYLVLKRPADPNMLGDIAYLNGDVVVDSMKPFLIGKNALLVGDESAGSIALLSGEIAVEGVRGSNELILKDFKLPGETVASFASKLADNSYSVALYGKGGPLAEHIYLASSYDIATSTLTLRGLGDDPPLLMEDYVSSTFAIYDMSAVRNHFSQFTVKPTSVGYVSPSVLAEVDADGVRRNRILGTTYVFNLRQSATDITNKLKVWADYVKSENWESSYYHKALVAAPSMEGRWDYNSEHVATSLINSINNTGSNLPGIFDGFNIEKVFHSNDDYNLAAVSSDNRLRPSSEGGGSFTGKLYSGTLLELSSTSLTAYADQNGEVEIELEVPTAAATFSLKVDGVLIPGEDGFFSNSSEATTTGALVPDRYSFVLPESVTSPVRLESEIYVPEIVLGKNGSAANVAFALVDENGSRINSNAAVVMTVLDETATFVDSGTSQLTTNLSSGRVEVAVKATAIGSFLVHAVVDNSYSVLSIVNVVGTEGVDDAVAMRFKRVQAIGDKGEKIRVSARVVDRELETVYNLNNEERLVTFTLERGPSKRVIDSLAGKGIVLMVDEWQQIWQSWLISDSSNFSVPVNSGGVPTLPLMISAGQSGMDSDFRTFSLGGSFIAEKLLTTTLNTNGQDYRGIMGYIGPSGFTLDFTNHAGIWDKGVFTPRSVGDFELKSRHFLAQEVIRAYSSASQPKLGDLWTEAVIELLDRERNRSSSDSINTRAEAADQLKRLLENWSSLGMAGLRLPTHQSFPTVNGLAGDVPVPSIKLVSENVRADGAFDRFETPVIEVPHKTDNSGNLQLTVQVSNLDTVRDDNGNVVSRGMLEYDPNIKFRYTLVSVPLDQPYEYTEQYPARISEIDFDGPRPSAANISIVSIGEPGRSGGNVTFTFHEHWESDANGIKKRGPAMYMVKVEAQEKSRVGSELHSTQVQPNFTKESRLFFKIVNEFKAEEGTQFLLVNNTDKDPYKQRTASIFSDTSTMYVPNAALRYYEDALDNYQYTKGTVSLGSVDTTNQTVTIKSDSPTTMYWKDRVKKGDLIRINQKTKEVFTDWLRISAVSSDGTTITLEDPKGLIQASKDSDFSKSEYYIQRSYTAGTAMMSYDWASISVAPSISSTVTLKIPTAQQKGFLDVVKAGSFFKLLDGRAFVKIAAVSATANSEEFTLTLEKNYPYETLYHYYSLNNLWGSVGQLSPGAGSKTLEGSYAIYPPNADGTKPSYLYQTWHVHNYVTTNDSGLGVHGDVYSSALDAFAVGDENGIRHKAVVWANDAGYGRRRTLGNNRDRNLDGLADAEVIRGLKSFYLSDKDLAVVSGFLGKGGRLITGGQFNVVETVEGPSSIYKDQFGFAASEQILPGTEVNRVANDVVTNLMDSISIQDGQTDGKMNSVDQEALNNNVSAKQLKLVNGLAAPILNYSNGAALGDPAAIRVSGGPDTRPWAMIYKGFDFGSMSFSGKPSEYSDLPSEGFVFGRRFFMKKSLDWLRDPSRTSISQKVKVTYFATDRESKVVPIELDFSTGLAVINDDLHAKNMDPLAFTGVGPNQDIVLSVTGGTIYNSTGYKWVPVGLSGGDKLATLKRDETALNNEDFHKVIFRTGSSISGSDKLQLTAPDGEVRVIDIQARDQNLFFWVPNVSDNVINNRFIYTGDLAVEFRVTGGDGAGTYKYTLVPGHETFANAANAKNLLEERESSVIYKVPANVPVSDPVSLTLQVESGSALKTQTVTILPPVSFATTNATVVQGGSPATLEVKGGSPTNDLGEVVGYNYSTSDSGSVSLTPSSDGTSVSVAVLSGVSLSENPNTPTKVTVTATDKTFVNSGSASAEVIVYSAPKPYFLDASNSLQPIADGNVITIPESGELKMQLLGGTGNTLVEVVSVSSTFLSSNILRNDLSSPTATPKVINSGESFTVSFSDNNMTLFTGSSSGTVTLKFTSDGSIVTRTLNLRSPVNVQVSMDGGATYADYTGETKTLKTVEVGSYSKSALLLKATSGKAPFTWTFTPNNLGLGFMTQGNYDAWKLSGQTLPPTDVFSASANTNVIGDSIVFVSSQTIESGLVSVTDSDGNIATIVVNVSNIDPLAWVGNGNADMEVSLASATTFEFTGGVAPYSISHTFTQSNTGVSAVGSQDTKTSIVIDAVNGTVTRQFVFRAYIQTGSGQVRVQDASGEVLVSKTITIGSSGSGAKATIPGAPRLSGAAVAGGGGCLLK